MNPRYPLLLEFSFACWSLPDLSCLPFYHWLFLSLLPLSIWPSHNFYHLYYQWCPNLYLKPKLLSIPYLHSYLLGMDLHTQILYHVQTRFPWILLDSLSHLVALTPTKLPKTDTQKSFFFPNVTTFHHFPGPDTAHISKSQLPLQQPAFWAPSFLTSKKEASFTCNFLPPIHLPHFL